MPVLAAAAIAAGSQLISGSMSANAANHAANTQANAARDAQQTQLQMYNQTRSDLAPYLSTGTGALSQLASMFGIGNGGPSAGTAQGAMSALQNYPGYQFQYDQGLQGLDRSAAARGLLLSGAQLKDAQTFGQGQAQSAWGSYLSQLNNLSSVGENAGAMVGNNGLATGQGIANSQLAQGQAQAAGIVGQNNAQQQGFQGALNNALFAYAQNNNGDNGISFTGPFGRHPAEGPATFVPGEDGLGVNGP